MATVLMTLPLGMSAQQMFWNPSQVLPYQPTGGNGAWSDANAWYDPALEVNISPAVNTGRLAYFEGSGTVTGNGNEPARIFFQNLSGNYNFTGNVNLRLPNNNTGHAVHVMGGSSDITFSLLGIGAGAQSNRSLRNDGTGTVTISTLNRQFGGTATNLTLFGDGNYTINGVGNMGGILTLSGGGRVNYSAPLGAAVGATGAVGFTSVVLNSGELFASAAGQTNFTWNGGTLVYNLSGVDNSSNTIVLGGTFTRGSGDTFAFDFGGSGIQETYTLLAFASTNFPWAISRL
ncbi:MAG: hypothetical protein LR015_07655 [Verrucomicrobia bacterium]|nr:hypothetical protein [Verrucomicrobiota bacterium]